MDVIKLIYFSILLFEYVFCGKLDLANMTLRWITDYSSQTVEFTIKFEKIKPSFVILLITNNGDFRNNDGFLYRTTENSVQDVYIDNELEIRRDMEQSIQVTKNISDGIKFIRKLVTCDPKDYAFEIGTTQFMIGESYNLSIVPNNVKDSRWIWEKRFGKILEHPDENKKQEIETGSKEFVVHSRIFNLVPAIETTYQCIIQRVPFDTISKKYHIIRMEPYITKGSEHVVHHMEIYLCQQEVEEWTGNCNDPTKPKSSKSCSHVIAAWAMGEGPIHYPIEAGMPVGGRGKDEYFMVEVHYNNPEKMNDVLDDSGFKFHITPNLRKYDAGIMEAGLIYSDANSIPPKQRLFPMKGYCPKECTKHLPEEGINVFFSQLHAHLTGRKIWTTHYRNGVKIGEINRDEHFTPHWQHLQPVRPFAKVLPGDELVTTCLYDTRDRTNVTLSGYGINDEMCVNYMYYYPTSSVEVCKSAISNTTLRSYFAKWHSQHNPETPISELYSSVKDWNADYTNELFEMLTVGNLNVHCLKGDSMQLTFGSKEDTWENMKRPDTFSGTFHLSRDTKECPALNDLF